MSETAWGETFTEEEIEGATPPFEGKMLGIVHAKPPREHFRTFGYLRSGSPCWHAFGRGYRDEPGGVR